MDESSEVPDVVVRALRLAEERQKPLIFGFFAHNRLGKKMLRELLANEEIVESLKEEFFLAWSGSLGEDDLARHYRVYMFPTLLYLDGKGREVERVVDYRKPWVLLNDLRELQKGRSVVRDLEARLALDPKDAKARFEFGKRLVERGRFDEGLKEFLRVWDDGAIEPGPIWHHERRVEPLAEIASLGPRLPRAIDELRERKRTCAAKLRNSEAASTIARDFVALNRIVGTPDDVLVLWESLASDPPGTGHCKEAGLTDFYLMSEIRPLLIKDRRYADFLDGAYRRAPDVFGGPRERTASFFDQERRSHRILRKVMPVDLLQVMENETIARCANFFEALMGTSQGEIAFWLARECLNEFDEVQVGDEFADRSVRLGLKEEQDRLRELQAGVRNKRRGL